MARDNNTIIEYDIESLKKAMDKCDDNIKIFEEAIMKEEATKREYRRIISALEAKKKPV